jgi:hypothetical protein
VLMISIVFSFSPNYLIISFFMSILFWLVGSYCLILFSSISHGKYLQKNILFFDNNNLCLVFFIRYTIFPLLLRTWL